MAKSADQLDKDSTYDKSGIEPSDLKDAEDRAVSPGGQSTSTGGDKVKYTSGKTKTTAPSESSTSTSPGKIGYSSEVPPEERSLYNSSSTTRGKVRFANVFSTRRRKLVGGVVAGLLGSGTIAFFVFLLPVLRLEGYLATIDQRVFATASNAVTQRLDHLFENYMLGYVLALDKCGGKISATCRANYSNAGIATGLYKSWQDARIEERLFDNYHFQLISNKNPSAADNVARYVLEDPFGNKLNFTNGDLRRGNFTGGSRVMGQEINKMLSEQTQWYQYMQRHSVRKYLVRKHGVKFWCFFACKTRDSIDNKILDARTRFKYKLVQRIIYPFSPKLGLIMDCLINPDSPKCTPDGLRASGIDRSLLSDDEVKSITDAFAKDKSLTFTQLMLQKLITRIANEEIAQKSVSAIPVAGQIYLALSVVDMLNTADKCLQDYCISKYAADLNADQYLEYYATMRQASDEVKAGADKSDEVGTLMDQFNDGGRPAEQSLVYQSYSHPNENPATLADSTASKSYLCADGQPIPEGQLVCPDKMVKRIYSVEDIANDKIISGIEQALNIYQACPTFTIDGRCAGIRPVTIIHPILQKINGIASVLIDPIAQALIDAAKHTPGVSSIFNYLQDTAASLIQGFLSKVFPLPIQVDSPGRDKFDGLEAGGEVAASEFNKGGVTDTGLVYGLGGQLLTDNQQSAATAAYMQQQNYDDSHSGVLARVSNMANPNSLLSRFVAVIPSSWSQFSSSIVAMMIKPFGNMNSFWHVAYADSAANINAFGIPRFGYVANDPVFNADPALYTADYCQQELQKWQASKTDDPITKIDEYSTTDPCLLEQVAVEAGSGVFTGDDSL